MRKMVNKQVDKQIAEMRKEILLMNLELRVQMAAELKEHLGQAAVTQTTETPKPYSASATEETERRKFKDKKGRKKREKQKERRQKTEEERKKEKSQSKKEFNSNHSETQSFEVPHPKHLSPKPDQGTSIFLTKLRKSNSGNKDIRDTEINHCPCENHHASKQTQCGLVYPSGDPAVCNSCKRMEKTEEKNSPQNTFQMFTVSEEESVGDRAKAEEDGLMKKQWKEWLDNQEMKGNMRHEHQRNVQQRAMSPGASEEKTMKTKTSGQTSTVKKIKTYISDFLNPSETCKWKKLEED